MLYVPLPLLVKNLTPWDPAVVRSVASHVPVLFFHNLSAKKMALLVCNPVILCLNVTLTCILLHHYVLFAS